MSVNPTRNKVNPPITESYWVKPGRFLAGEYPCLHAQLADSRLDAFLKAGINRFFDLTQPHELRSYEDVLQARGREHGMDVAYHRFSIRDHSIPSPETMIRLLDTIDRELSLGHNIYVHCWGGIGRTGITVGCYLVRHGETNEQALQRVNQLYRTRPRNPYYPNSPETTEQVQFVSSWREIPQASHQSRQNFCEG
jgi:protein-tyrosine phosphatase